MSGLLLALLPSPNIYIAGHSRYEHFLPWNMVVGAGSWCSSSSCGEQRLEVLETLVQLRGCASPGTPTHQVGSRRPRDGTPSRRRGTSGGDDMCVHGPSRRRNRALRPCDCVLRGILWDSGEDFGHGKPCPLSRDMPGATLLPLMLRYC